VLRNALPSPLALASFPGACLPLLCQIDSFKAQLFHIAPASDALVVGLQGVFSALAESRAALANPAVLRNALPSLFGDGARLKLTAASEAGEAFEALVALFTESADQRFVATVERHCAMSIMEMCECSCDEMLEPLHYKQAAAYVSVPLLLHQLSAGQADVACTLTAQLASTAGPLCPTANCGNHMTILRYLMPPMPGLLPVGLSWESAPAQPATVHQLLAALPTTIDLQSAFKSTPQPATASLRGVLCGAPGGGTSASFSYDATAGWVHSADGAIVGQDWSAVAAACSEHRYKPGLLIYQVHPSQF